MKKKVLVIGLDGATWKCLLPWFDQGKLPYLKSVYESGASGVLSSVIPTQTAVSWTSFQTGVNPGRHGVFDFLKVRNKEIKEEIVTSDDVNAKSFWDYLARINKASIAVNLPVTYPTPTTNSIIVSGFLTPPGEQYVNDARLQKKLDQLGYVVDLEVGRGAIIDSKRIDRAKIFDEVVDMAKRRLRACEILAKERDWDMFFVLIKETDIIQHFFFDDNRNLEFWEMLDKMLNKFVTKFDRDNRGIYKVFLSDHGFHKASRYNFSIYTWLRDHDFIKNNVQKSSGVGFWFFAQKIYFLLRSMNIDLVKIPVFAHMSKRKIDAASQDLPIKASGYGIFLDKKRFGKDTNNVKRKIIKALKETVYEGSPVFRLVESAQNYYSGECLSDGPDIVFLADEKFLITTSPFVSSVVRERPKDEHRGGDHLSALDGLYMITGPGILKKRNINARIFDMTPTVLAILGYRSNIDFDGSVIFDIFSKKLSRFIEAVPVYNEEHKVQSDVEKAIMGLSDL